MEGLPITILLSLVACAASVMMRPGAALGVVIASSLLWPEYLRISMGAQMSVPRLGALILLLRLMMSPPGEFAMRWRLTDTLVVAMYVWLLIANFLAGTPAEQFKTVVGSGFDTVAMYLVARKVLCDPAEVKGMVKGLVATVLVMAPLGLIENVTRWSPYSPFLASRQGTTDFQGGGSEIRFGMRRAFVSTLQPIFYGMALVVVTGVLFSMRRVFETKWAQFAVMGTTVLAVLTSLSSGPWAGLIALMGLNALYWRPSLIKPAILMVVLMMVAMEALSNRHFYHLISYFALDGSSAYYRSRLMEVAVMHLPEYWLFGYGGQPMNYWGMEIDGRGFVDMVNNYLIVACSGGVLAMLLYIGVKISALVVLVKAYKGGPAPVKQVCFGLSAGLIALSLSEVSVGLFGPALPLAYIALGCAVSCGEWVEQLARREASRLRMLANAEKGEDEKIMDVQARPLAGGFI